MWRGRLGRGRGSVPLPRVGRMPARQRAGRPHHDFQSRGFCPKLPLMLWEIIGMAEGQVLLFVAYTVRAERIRIISARRATRDEQNHYFRENTEADDAGGN